MNRESEAVRLLKDIGAFMSERFGDCEDGDCPSCRLLQRLDALLSTSQSPPVEGMTEDERRVEIEERGYEYESVKTIFGGVVCFEDLKNPRFEIEVTDFDADLPTNKDALRIARQYLRPQQEKGEI